MESKAGFFPLLQKRYSLPHLPAKSAQEVAEEDENDGLSYAPWITCDTQYALRVAQTLGTKGR